MANQEKIPVFGPGNRNSGPSGMGLDASQKKKKKSLLKDRDNRPGKGGGLPSKPRAPINPINPIKPVNPVNPVKPGNPGGVLPSKKK